MSEPTHTGPRPWTILDRRILVHDPWLHLEAQRVLTAEGVALDPFYVIGEQSWSCVLAIRPDGRVITVEQYRHGVGHGTLEFPAGGIDHGEDPAAAAARELKEETGYAALTPPRSLGRFHPEPSRSGSCGHGFLIRVGMEPAAAEPEAAEAITVHALSIADLVQARKEERFCHAVHVAVFYQAMADGLIILD